MEKKKQLKVLGGNTNPPAPKTPKPCNRWCFTVFTSEDDKPRAMASMMYLCCGFEICPTTKNTHWQCWTYLYEKVSFKQAKIIITESCNGKIPHIEPCFKSIEENDRYCKKDGKFFTEGEIIINQGNRTDLIEIKNSILNNNVSVDDLVIENPMLYHQYGRTLNKLEDLKMRNIFRTEMTTCIWYYGKTGVGKSHKAFEGYSPNTHYLWRNDNGWWEGYCQQEIVIMNDYRGEIKYNELLQLIDKFPYFVKRRGREPLPFTSKHIIITSSLKPDEIYKNREDEDKIEQLLRRIELVKLISIENS